MILSVFELDVVYRWRQISFFRTFYKGLLAWLFVSVLK